METEFPESEINTFLRPLFAEEDSNILRLLAPNLVVLQQVRNRFLGRIEHFFIHSEDHAHSEVREVKLLVGSPETAENPPPSLCKIPLLKTPCCRDSRSRNLLSDAPTKSRTPWRTRSPANPARAISIPS